MERAWPLVGREAELALVRRALAAGRGAVLAGPAGVGKTRLLAEATALVRAQHPDALALGVRASPSSSALPLGAFTPLLDLSTTQSHSLASARRDLLAQAGGRLLVLSIDDAHALDESSAALAHQLAAEDSVRLLATTRTTPTPAHALPAAVLALWKDELCERVEVGPLARDEVIHLLQAVLGAPIDGAAAHRVWEATRGNVLFVRELVAGAVTTGELEERDQVWVLTRPLAAPARVHELLDERIAGLGPDERTALEALALGEPLPLELVAQLVGDRAIENLEQRGLVELGGDPFALEARLGHPLIGDVVVDGMGRARRRRLLRDLVAASNGRDGCDLGPEGQLRLTTWRIEAGLDVEVDALLAAAQRYVLVDPDLATSFARRARDAGAGLVAIDTLADVLVFGGRPDEAATLYASTPARSVEERLVLASRLALVEAFGMGRAREAATHLEQVAAEARAVAVAGGDAGGEGSDDHGERWGEVAGRLALTWFLAGDMARTLAAAEAVARDPRTTAVDRLRAELVTVPALFVAGRPVTAVGLAAEVVPRVLAHADALGSYAPGQLAAAVSLAHQLAGDLDAGEGVARAAYDEASRRDVRLSRGGAALRLGQVALWRGAVGRAERLLREAVACLDGDDVFRASAIDHLRLARVLAGRTDEPAPLAPSGLCAVEHAWIEAALAGARGETSAARRQAFAAADLALATGQTTYALVAVFEAARQGAAGAAAERLRDLPPVEGALAEALRRAILAYGSGDGDGDALDRAARWMEDIGCLLHAAELATTAAVHHAAAGRRSPAAASAARAQRLAAQCEGATTERLRRTPVAQPLTDREREVAMLAGRGAADAEIADRLVISVRTVESHLYRAYAKLGVTGRGELPTALGL